MDKLKRPNKEQYAYLRQLPIGKLLKLLEVAPVPASCPEDEAYVDALEDVIIEKENEHPTGFFPDADQQWEQFATHYLPDLEEETALEPKRMEHPASAQVNQQPFTVPQKHVVRLSRVCRTGLVAAIAIICMLVIMVTAQAAGVDVFGAMARWTKDVFSFGHIPPDSQVSDSPARKTTGQEAKAPDTEFSSLQEAFDAYGMTEVHEPAWLPDGYALKELCVMCLDDPFLRTFSASYTADERFIGIDIMSYEDEPASQVQKIDGPVESVEKKGVTFYHIENSVGRTIAWCSGQYEYYLSGDTDEDILLKVAESMFG